MRKKYKWIAKSLFTNNAGGQALKACDNKELRESYLVDGNSYPLPAEIDIYDDKVTMLSFQQNEFVGIIIQNAPFAQTLRSIFMLAYQAARNLQTCALPQEQPVQASSAGRRPAQTQKLPGPSPRPSGKTQAS